MTHLYAALRPDALRAEQVTELINWTHERDDVPDKILCGDCNSTLESDSMKLLASEFRPTQTLPTAFTPLAEKNGAPSHADWPRKDRCIDFIWVTNSIRIVGSGRCFDRPAEADATLWPSDHVGVWADLELG